MYLDGDKDTTRGNRILAVLLLDVTLPRGIPGYITEYITEFIQHAFGEPWDCGEGIRYTQEDESKF